MYLKVKAGDKDAVIYELSSSDFFIGSGSVAHLVILDPGVSKKHLRLFMDEDSWFAIDQGSTNGSFFENEKLIPGKVQEIELDKELKLGHQVYITLLETASDALPIPSSHEVLKEQAASKKSDEDKTQIISLEDFKAAKALAEKQKKRELQRKKAAQLKKKQEDQNKIARSVLVFLVVIAAGIYVNKVWNSKKSKVKKDTIVNKIKTKMKSDQEIDTDLLGYRISRSSLISRNRINGMKNTVKCTDPNILRYCTRGGQFLGGQLDGDNLILFADEKSWAKKVFTDFGKNEALFRKVLFLLALKREFSQFSNFEKMNVFLAFYKIDENQIRYLSFVGAVDSKIIPMINEKFREETIGSDIDAVTALTNDLDQYYIIY
jgi:pSer/pThr/pTyr-binding forkhead associated (FHA) protein